MNGNNSQSGEDAMPDPDPAPVRAAITARQEVGRELSKVPGLKYEISENRVRVEPMFEDGFPVEVYAKDEGGFSVYFSVWNTEFLTEDDALDCFFFGLCDDCRLEVTSRGSYDYRWTMQALEEDQWTSYSTTAMLVFPFWSRKTVRYLQNRVLKAPEPQSSEETADEQV